MTLPLRVLLADDNPADRALVRHSLGREFADLFVEQVGEPAALARVEKPFLPDAVRRVVRRVMAEA